MSEKIIFNDETQRIDIRLTKKFPYSRNFFHHIISRWWILVNKKTIKKSYKLQPWDIIQIDELERFNSPLVLEECPKIDIPIILEKEDFLIINKPKFVLSHPNSIRDLQNPSVVWFLYHKYKELPSIWNFIRAWLIHRLDKETDWLMIIAKTEKWLKHFKQLFQDKSESKTISQKELVNLKKFYQTKVHLSEKWKTFLEEIKTKLPYYIIKDVIPKTPNPNIKEWITKILSIRYQDKSAIIDLEILTGRTHQIRYHLSQAWLPIIWDYLYWKDKTWPIQLTAKKLIFKDLDWAITTIEI